MIWSFTIIYICIQMHIWWFVCIYWVHPYLYLSWKGSKKHNIKMNTYISNMISQTHVILNIYSIYTVYILNIYIYVYNQQLKLRFFPNWKNVLFPRATTSCTVLLSDISTQCASATSCNKQDLGPRKSWTLENYNIGRSNLLGNLRPSPSILPSS